MPQTQKNNKPSSDPGENIKKQVNWWIGLGLTMPMTTLTFMFLLNLFGTEEWYSYALSIGGAGFAMIGFIWWWWAIHAIATFSDAMARIGKNFDNLQKELSKLKTDIKKK